MCLSIFLEQPPTIGRIIALDEAHKVKSNLDQDWVKFFWYRKYMNSSTEANNLTNTLLSTIRLQRHLGARVLILTQEPTISPALLDLCSITIVHRFTSPAWLHTLKTHLAALDLTQIQENGENTGREVFGEIVKLRVGEALCFSPSAMVDVEKLQGGQVKVKKLGTGYLKIKVRDRLTQDGGKSIMATWSDAY